TARFWPHENPTPCGHPEDRPLGDGRESGAAARAAQGRGVRRHAGDAVSRHPRAGARQSGRAGRRVALRTAAGGGGGHPAAPRATAPRRAGFRRWRRSAARGEDASRPRAGPAALNTLTAAERSAGWRLLFDGKTTAGWRGYKQDSVPPGWQVVDGALTRVNSGGDIMTRNKYRNFELTLEWNIAAGGNSGI